MARGGSCRYLPHLWMMKMFFSVRPRNGNSFVKRRTDSCFLSRIIDYEESSNTDCYRFGSGHDRATTLEGRQTRSGIGIAWLSIPPRTNRVETVQYQMNSESSALKRMYRVTQQHPKLVQGSEPVVCCRQNHAASLSSTQIRIIMVDPRMNLIFGTDNRNPGRPEIWELSSGPNTCL